MSTGLEEVVAQQRMTNRLLALIIQRMWPDSVPQNELVEILSDTGATSEEVAIIIGTSKATVEVTKHRKARKREVLRDRAEEPSADGVRPAGHDEPVRDVEQGE